MLLVCCATKAVVLTTSSTSSTHYYTHSAISSIYQSVGRYITLIFVLINTCVCVLVYNRLLIVLLILITFHVSACRC
jgi:hypothetical protein